MMPPKGPLALGLLSLVIFVPIAGLVAIPYALERFEAPNDAKIRTYRLSKFSDEKLIKLHEDAVQRAREAKQYAAEEGRRFWEESAQQRQACEADPAAKLRDPHHCNKPLPAEWPSIGQPLPGADDPEAIFERSVMGVCRLAGSVYEAKQMGCLPP